MKRLIIIISSIISVALAMVNTVLADSVARCAKDSIPGDYIDVAGERAWCAQEGLWNILPVLLAFFSTMNSWIPIICGLAALVIGGTLTGSPAKITGWISGSHLIHATFHPAIAGSSNLLLRFVGALLSLSGIVLLLIGIMFLLTG